MKLGEDFWEAFGTLWEGFGSTWEGDRPPDRLYIQTPDQPLQRPHITSTKYYYDYPLKLLNSIIY